MGALIAVINKKDENAAETAFVMLEILKYKSAETLGMASPITIQIEKSMEALRNAKIKSPIIIGHIFSKILTVDRPQPIRLNNATMVFDGRIYPPAEKISDAGAAAGKMVKPLGEAVEAFIKKTDGDFSFAIAEMERIIAGRDTLGARPLYYGENADLAALASGRKALWRAGIKKAYSFPPGNMAFIDKHGFKFKPVKILTFPMAKHVTMQTAAKQLQILLQHSIKERISGLKEAAVAFSGGLDSSLIAFLAKSLGVDVHLVYVSLKDQPEIEHAKIAAEELQMPIHIYLYNEGEVEETLPKVLWLIEEADPVKASVGIPMYWTAERAAEAKFRILLAGQGADELFGGYKRYADVYARFGGERARETIFKDTLKMYESNFERDFKICNFHNLELRIPFAAYQIAKFAAELPLELKVELPNNGLRKLVLRRVARNLGLPKFIVEKKKMAIQYATGVNKILKKLAKKEGLQLKEYVKKIFEKVTRTMGL
ncbi:MAG: asparagine synthetase B [Candidatus Bathyarchaeia archaeon]